MAKVVSCEISFIPVQSSDYITDVDKVVNVIRASGLEHSVEPFSTVVRGEFEKVIELVRDIYLLMDNSCRFIIDIKLSNVCGCDI